MGNCLAFASIPSKKTFRRKHFKIVKRWIQRDCAGQAKVFPHYLPEILENVMGFLDPEALKTCRFVSAEWNNEALRILAKRWFISIDEQHFVKELKSYWEDPESTQNFCQTVAECQDPQHFFTNIKVPLNTIEQNKEIREIIQIFGIHLKTLYLGEFFESPDKVRHYELIKEVLTYWCPNLTTLTVDIQTGHFPTPQNGHKFIPFNPLRNVTTLELHGVRCNDGNSRHCNEFALFLIKSCTKLNSLQIRAPFHVFRKLSEFPGITRNLEKFTWSNYNGIDNVCACASLKSLSSLQFSSRLKHLDLRLSVSLSDPECRQLLYRVLRKLSSHLEFFKFDVDDYFPPTRSLTDEDKEMLRSYRPTVHWSDVEALVPEMRKLKVLILNGNHVFGLDSFQFLKKCPNLVKLQLGYDGCGFICISNYPDKVLENSQFDWIQTEPRVNLKELDIRGDWVQEAVFTALPKGFLNLTSLSINDYTDTLQWVIVRSITKLEHLMDLALNIREWFALLCFPLILPEFKNCKALRTLKIINARHANVVRDLEDRTCKQLWRGLSPLKDLNCTFTFKKFPMKEKEENKLLSIAKKKGMHLKWLSINTNNKWSVF